jgi:hypothetical protein
MARNSVPYFSSLMTKTLDELRQFRAPWAWALPAMMWALIKRSM